MLFAGYMNGAGFDKSDPEWYAEYECGRIEFLAEDLIPETCRCHAARRFKLLVEECNTCGRRLLRDPMDDADQPECIPSTQKTHPGTVAPDYGKPCPRGAQPCG